MRYFTPLLGITALMASAALAEVTTDTTGRQVTLPDAPARIISLNEPALTIPMIELGVVPVGSFGRNADGSYQFGADFIVETFGPDAARPAGFGLNGQIDLEQMRLLQPDLILGTELDMPKADQFSTVAPTYLQAFMQGDLRDFGIMRNLARVLGRQARFDELHHAYALRLDQSRKALPMDPAGKTYLLVMVTDQLQAIGDGSGATQALDDLGFARFSPDGAGTDGQPPLMLPLSPESFGRMNPDLLVFISSWAQPDRDGDAIRAKLDQVLPEWQAYLPPAQDNRIIYLDSAQVFTPSFASATHTLDAVDQWATTH